MLTNMGCLTIPAHLPKPPNLMMTERVEAPLIISRLNDDERKWLDTNKVVMGQPVGRGWIIEHRQHNKPPAVAIRCAGRVRLKRAIEQTNCQSGGSRHPGPRALRVFGKANGLIT